MPGLVGLVIAQQQRVARLQLRLDHPYLLTKQGFCRFHTRPRRLRCHRRIHRHKLQALHRVVGPCTHGILRLRIVRPDTRHPVQVIHRQVHRQDGSAQTNIFDTQHHPLVRHLAKPENGMALGDQLAFDPYRVRQLQFHRSPLSLLSPF